MTLIATPGAPDAESYLSVADADALATGGYGPERDGWLDLSDQVAKERLLRQATRQVDSILDSGWPRYSATQSLRFPRDADVVAGAPVIVADVRHATYHQAIYVLANAKVLAAGNTRAARGVRSASEPSMSYTQDDDPWSGAISPDAMGYLHRYRTYAPGGGSRGAYGSARVLGGLAASR